MSLTNPDSVVTEERLAQFYNGILPYLGGMPDVLANKFNKSNLYSTDEKMVGRWIDGKPLYQKTIDCGALPNNTTKNVAHGITNFGIMLVSNAFAYSTQWNLVTPLPYVHKTNSAYDVQLYVQDSNIIITTGSDHSSDNGYVTLQYTKTTDSVVAIGSDTDYSTDEKIIGTWIDGKPIYQKTWTGLSVSVGGSSWTVIANVPNSEHLINAVGYFNGGASMLTFKDAEIDNQNIRVIGNNTRTINIFTAQYTKTS